MRRLALPIAAFAVLAVAGCTTVSTAPDQEADLSRRIGVEPPSADERHSALADARWCVRMWDAVMGS